jgi:hypothetical protein
MKVENWKSRQFFEIYYISGDLSCWEITVGLIDCTLRLVPGNLARHKTEK